MDCDGREYVSIMAEMDLVIQPCVAPEMGAPHYWQSLAKLLFSLFCGCLSSPESTSLSQLESMWGTAERDNDVWQPVFSMLHVFNCLVGNAASHC